MMETAEKIDDSVTYHVARSKDELEQSYALVYNEYAKKGYIPPHYKSNLRLSLFNAVPATTTFVAKKGNKVVATVTLVVDSPMGIPMDKIFKKEVDELRATKKVAEVSQLSIDTDMFPGLYSMFNFSKLIFIFKLFKLVLDYSLSVAGLDELCIAINPKQQFLYKFLSFEKVGKLKYYGSVNKAPAIALHLDMRAAAGKLKNKKAAHKIFFGSTTPAQLFENKYMLSADDLIYFFAQKSDMLLTATRDQLAFLEQSYNVSLKEYYSGHP